MTDGDVQRGRSGEYRYAVEDQRQYREAERDVIVSNYLGLERLRASFPISPFDAGRTEMTPFHLDIAQRAQKSAAVRAQRHRLLCWMIITTALVGGSEEFASSALRVIVEQGRKRLDPDIRPTMRAVCRDRRLGKRQ